MARDVEDRVTGVLLGLAAGDRIGGPVRMALELADGLRVRGDFDRDDIRARYLQWWREGGFDTGPTAARVLELNARGMPIEDAVIRVDMERRGSTAGCNPAHRSAPLAMPAAIADARLAEVAKAEACLTHRHPLAGDTAAAVVVLCRALIRGVPWAAALDMAAAGRLEETRCAIQAPDAEDLARGGFAPDVLRAAIRFVHTSPSFSIALRRSIEFAGASKYCPVLVGSIGGARWGRAAIDAQAITHHASLLPRLCSAAAGLAASWANAGT
jgi:ADP-ribosyl-[dinitrogen reductase] hydrolase